ncbi:hypothetical protein E1B28_002758 [Marasmius oreades]|uniref:RRM domain-containing protein n=1 Tax=Marasmius oreades TaxID=181124 RepID=A0A9P7UL68_9AGAR|nr:uncharacterized protein E1B28_002758 [Marasmius oreades]KAG7086837.1 hypothetical protein E1B28_002758 [Marasmius oreades]
MSSNNTNSTPSPARAPPSPPDSPKSRTGINNSPASCTSRTGVSRPPSSASVQSLHIASVPLSSSLHQHTLATSLSPGLDTAISTYLPSSPPSRPSSSYRSSSVSPNPAAALHRATRRDQDAEDASFELGSEVSSGDVAEAQGLMHSLGFSSPITPPPLGPKAMKDAGLEDGEISEGVLAEKMSCDSSVASVVRSRQSSSFSSASGSPRQYRQTGPRVRHDFQHGSAIPSSPETVPGMDLEASPGHRRGSITVGSMHSAVSSQSNTPKGSVTPVPTSVIQRPNGTGVQNDIDATGSISASIAASNSSKSAISSLPSITSTLSSLSSFHTASSSTGSIPTSVSTSGSPGTNHSLCDPQQSSSVLPQSQIIISESGTIHLPPPTMDVTPNGGPTSTLLSSPSSTLNPNAPEHIPTSQATSDIDAGLKSESMDLESKSPNVYINGLPPHFPEDQLFELAAPFGEIRSVRSFTRHVGEKESGYGFVLFETVEAAEKCINNLRKFRNLHPTFSKQTHKIPGIPFAPEQDNGNQSVTGSASPTGSFYASVNGVASEPFTFKSKMERLADPSSTNLYIEGLPLSIDEPSLIALVSPHRIKSSRFFQTRLSNPPRIIAFVRLETRSGAEEVVERLHGRMVRGWNDPGSRISVRFADTSEQRELRRQERTVRGGEESSPARLTIAQAALLNLRGRDQMRAQSVPVIGSRHGGARGSSDAPTANQAYHDFSSNMARSTYRSGSDYPVQSGRRTLAQTAPYDQPISLPPPTSLLQNTQNIDPAMAAILGSLRGDGMSPNPSVANDIGTVYEDWPDEALQHQGGYHQRQHMSGLRNQVLGDVDLNQLGYAVNQYRRGGAAQARGGFTPREELILQAHNAARNSHRLVPHRDAQLQTQHFCHPEAISDPAVADYNVGVGVRGYRTQASTISVSQSQHQSSYSPGGLPAVMEDESQTISPSAPVTYTRSQILSIGNRMGIIGRGHSDASSGGQHISSQQHDSHGSRAQAQSSNRISNDNNQAHVRSTTLPSASTTSAHRQLRHAQHSSMSIPKSRNLITDIMRTTAASLPQPRQTSSNSSSIMSNNDPLVKSSAKNSDIRTGASTYTSEVASNHLHDGTAHYYHGKQSNNFDIYNNQPRQQARQLGQEFHQHQQTQKSFRRDGGIGNYDNGSGDGGESGSPLVSPALTYSSRGSAGTLSPSTPFVGTFAQAPGSGRGLEADA